MVVYLVGDEGLLGVMKLGEDPPYSPLVPTRLVELIKPDRECFLQGWRAESLGMGIGAFTYYRRVVERQKNRLFDQLIAAVRREGASAESVDGLEYGPA